MASKATKTTRSTPDRATEYAKAVVSGSIIAGPHVRNACRRHLDDLERGSERGLWYDEDEAAKTYRFFEETGASAAPTSKRARATASRRSLAGSASKA
jgi:phage terminase large subunit-like protein